MSFNFKRKKFNQFLEQKGFEIENYNYNEALGDILRGLGGFVMGAKRGFETSAGTDDMREGEDALERRLNIAIDNFVKNLVRVQPTGATIDQQKNIRKFLSGNIHHLLNYSLNFKIMKKAYDIVGTGSSTYVTL